LPPLVAGRLDPEQRAIPKEWKQKQRKELLAIAARCHDEVCSSYAAVAIGLQLFHLKSGLDLASKDA